MEKAWLWTPAVLLLVAAVSYGAFLMLQPPSLPPGIVYGNGYIEGTEVDVSAEIAGQVVETAFSEGERVARGELLARIDAAGPRASLAQAEAQAEAVRRERAVVRQELAIARHHRETAQAEVERYRALRQTGTVTLQQLGEVEDRLREAEGRGGALEARLAQLEARQEAAERQIELLQLQLGKTEIRAPLTATLLAKGIEAGELAAPGRLVATLVDLTRLELKVFLSERDIGKVKPGDPARVRIDAFPERYFDARVVRIDQRAQFTPRDIHMPEERVRTVFGVTLALEKSEGYLKPGLPADAWIRWAPGVEWPAVLPVPT